MTFFRSSFLVGRELRFDGAGGDELTEHSQEWLCYWATRLGLRREFAQPGPAQGLAELPEAAGGIESAVGGGKDEPVGGLCES